MRFLAALNASKSVAPATTLEKLKEIPLDFWMRLGLGVLTVIALVFFLRKVAKMNKVVLTVVTFVIVSVVGFNWVYERTEPEWATPVVNFLSGFFPTKGPPAKKPASSLAQRH